MQWKTLRILGLTSVAITIAAGCTSKPTLPDDHSTKRWVVTVGGDPVARGGDDQENAGNNLQGTSGKKLKTAPFWDVGSTDVAGDRGATAPAISKKSITFFQAWIIVKGIPVCRIQLGWIVPKKEILITIKVVVEEACLGRKGAVVNPKLSGFLFKCSVSFVQIKQI